MNIPAGCITGPVLNLRFIERDGERVLQFCRMERGLFYDSEDVFTPPSLQEDGPPVKVWRDVEFVTVELLRGGTNEGAE